LGGGLLFGEGDRVVDADLAVLRRHEVEGQLRLEPRDEVEAGERLDEHHLLDLRHGQVEGGEARVEVLCHAEDLVRVHVAVPAI
jgi:hypothetical protein